MAVGLYVCINFVDATVLYMVETFDAIEVKYLFHPNSYRDRICIRKASYPLKGLVEFVSIVCEP